MYVRVTVGVWLTLGKFDPSLLGLDDDLSDQFDGPNHRDGEDGDLFNGKVRKKVPIACEPK
jgi:hypothetical protein